LALSEPFHKVEESKIAAIRRRIPEPDGLASALRSRPGRHPVRHRRRRRHHRQRLRLRLGCRSLDLRHPCHYRQRTDSGRPGLCEQRQRINRSSQVSDLHIECCAGVDWQLPRRDTRMSAPALICAFHSKLR
jgi:hypothetical protein